VNPACPTNREPDIVVGECPACKAAGRHGDLVAHKSEKTGKRFIRCTNYDECGTSYPLPQRGELHATGRDLPRLRPRPSSRSVTPRGPCWRICVRTWTALREPGGTELSERIRLDMDPARSLSRATAQGADRLEAEGLGFQARVREGFLRLAAEEPERVRVVDADGSVEEVHARLLAAVADVLAGMGIVLPQGEGQREGSVR
jgi:hypothetical protein